MAITQDTKDNVFILLRSVLMIASSYVLGKNIFGTTIDENVWQEVISSVIAVVTIVWGFLDKTLPLEGFQTAIRGIISFVGTLFVAKNVLSDNTLAAILALSIPISQTIYAFLSKSKSKKLESGQISVAQLKK